MRALFATCPVGSYVGNNQQYLDKNPYGVTAVTRTPASRSEAALTITDARPGTRSAGPCSGPFAAKWGSRNTVKSPGNGQDRVPDRGECRGDRNSQTEGALC
jgi:hypothetical protein